MIVENEMTEEELELSEKWAQGVIDSDEITDPELRAKLGIEGEVKQELQDGLDEDDSTDLSLEETEKKVEDSKPSDQKAKGIEEEKTLAKKLYEKSNELNTERQRNEARLKKLVNNPDELRKFLIDNGKNPDEVFKPIPTDDLYSDSTTLQTIQTINELKRKEILREQAREVMDANSEASVNVKAQVYQLQNEYEQLNTEKDIFEINQIALKNGGTLTLEMATKNGISERDFKAFEQISVLYKESNSSKKPITELALTKDFYREKIRAEERKRIEEEIRNERANSHRSEKNKYPKPTYGNMSSPDDQMGEGANIEKALMEIFEKQERGFPLSAKDEAFFKKFEHHLN